jgi:PAS domain S-box-containing protein
VDDSHGDGPRLLLVEDEAVIALATARALERYGYTVATVYHGEDAVRRAREDPPIDIILMDIDLGRGIDGTEAARRILSERDTPILFVSSHDEKEFVRRTEAVTSYGYVVKSAGVTVLDAAIKMAFRLHAARREQDQLRRTAERYLSVVAEIVLALAPDGTITMLNESGHRLLGYEPGSLVGSNWCETCIPAELRDEVRGMLEASLDIGDDSIRHHENEVVTRDGARRIILWHNARITDRDGRVTGVLSSGEDITARTTLAEELRRRTVLQALLIELSSLYLEHHAGAEPQDDDSVFVQTALERLGECLGADRVYVFAYDFPRGLAINTFEWCAPGIEPQIADLQDVPLTAIAEGVDRHIRGDSHYVADVARLPQGLMRSVLEPQGIRSLLTVPVMAEDACVGSVGFDFVRGTHHFSEDERDVLAVFARGIAALRGGVGR